MRKNTVPSDCVLERGDYPAPPVPRALMFMQFLFKKRDDYHFHFYSIDISFQINIFKFWMDTANIHYPSKYR